MAAQSVLGVVGNFVVGACVLGWASFELSARASRRSVNPRATARAPLRAHAPRPRGLAATREHAASRPWRAAP